VIAAERFGQKGNEVVRIVTGKLALHLTTT
jgi:hypothetical protein